MARFTPPDQNAVTLDAGEIFAQLSVMPKVPAKPETLRGTRVRSQTGDGRSSELSRHRSRSLTSAPKSATSKSSPQSSAKPSRSATALKSVSTRGAPAARNPQITLSQSSAHRSLTTAAISKDGRDLRKAVLLNNALASAEPAGTESPVDTAVNVFCGQLTAKTSLVKLMGFPEARQAKAISDSQRELWQRFWKKAFERVTSIERVHLAGYFGSALWKSVADYVFDEKNVAIFKIDTPNIPAYFGNLTTLKELYCKWPVIMPNAKIDEAQLKRINDRTTAFRRLLMKNPNIYAIEFSDYNEAAWANAIGAFKEFPNHLRISFANGKSPPNLTIGHQRLEVELNSYRDNLLLRPDQIGHILYVQTVVNGASALAGVQPFFVHALSMLRLELITTHAKLDLLQLFIVHVRNINNIPLLVIKIAAVVNFDDTNDIDRFKKNFAKVKAMFAALCVASFTFGSIPNRGVHLCEGQQFKNGVLRCPIRPLPKELLPELGADEVDNESEARTKNPFYRGNCKACRKKIEGQENPRETLNAASLARQTQEGRPDWSKYFGRGSTSESRK